MFPIQMNKARAKFPLKSANYNLLLKETFISFTLYCLYLPIILFTVCKWCNVQ